MDPVLNKFEDLGLTGPLLQGLEQAGYETPTPIQAQSIPEILDGNDVLGAAQTGTGKTAAFALPILQIMWEDDQERREPSKRRGGRPGRRPIRTLVLSPTRELSAQIEANFRIYGKKTRLRSTVIFGGVNQNPQVRELQSGVDTLVATPGRLLDLVNQGFIDLKDVEILVLDEADHMLDMGFLPDVKRILKFLPRDRQNLLFSATMPGPIRKLADEILVDPVTIQIAPQKPTVERIEQSICFVAQADKPRLLNHFIETKATGSTLVFTRTKHGADAVARRLVKAGVKAAAIHGNKTQANRVRTLNKFKNDELDVLVATDVAARGIDIDGIQTVINYDTPNTPEAYVHRIGRTGRAGREGETVMFCGGHETKFFIAIEREIKLQIPVATGLPGCQPRPLQDPESGDKASSRSGGRSGGGGQSGGGRSRSGSGAQGGTGGGSKPGGRRRRGRAEGSVSGRGSTVGRKSAGSEAGKSGGSKNNRGRGGRPASR
ncbi:MAG TPA: ATP-dependent helicase [Rhodopirellula baltica]|uniref:DEAD/DEAH box helicase n=1 Tax=Rhodopirellula baltica TaxID=265606 RepID=UPI000E865BF5|nr:DEAD/DEAH box helicase [Rhodopirellula baltica]HBE62752.1 ATP-dependent helicase [Rhodopirellula baltica]